MFHGSRTCSENARTVSIVHISNQIEFFCYFHDFGQLCYITIHGENPVGDDHNFMVLTGFLGIFRLLS
ncbi:hypothetical protein D3C76_1429340 [compost metagenome]